MANEPMTKTLIVAATREELAQTFDQFGWQKTSFVEHADFDVLITGVGMTATAFALGQRLNSSYNLVLNVGIAGSFDRTLELGTLVNVIEDTFSELGAQNGDDFIGIAELGFGKSAYRSDFTSDHALIKVLPAVRGITVNRVHGNAVSIQQTLERFDVKIESMEGAAVFYACEQLNVPVLQIRSISNYVEHRNKEAWKIGLAIKNLNEWLINYLNV
jgi:futalosine hydrolase